MVIFPLLKLGLPTKMSPHFLLDSKPKFAVVTTTKVSSTARVNGVSGLAYHRLNHDILVCLSRSYQTI